MIILVDVFKPCAAIKNHNLLHSMYLPISIQQYELILTCLC